ILGPSFTGSAQSLDLVLSHWLDSLPEPRPATEIKLISGSATGISVPPLDAQAAEDTFDFQNLRSRLGGRFQFRSMENRDSLTVPGFMRYLGGQQCGASGHAVKVALLIEGNTAYGRAAQTSIEVKEPKQIEISQEPNTERTQKCSGAIRVSNHAAQDQSDL